MTVDELDTVATLLEQHVNGISELDTHGLASEEESEVFKDYTELTLEDLQALKTYASTNPSRYR